MKFVLMFFTYIDFCNPNITQGLELNFNLYLLTPLRAAYVPFLCQIWISLFHKYYIYCLGYCQTY